MSDLHIEPRCVGFIFINCLLNFQAGLREGGNTRVEKAAWGSFTETPMPQVRAAVDEMMEVSESVFPLTAFHCSRFWDPILIREGES